MIPRSPLPRRFPLRATFLLFVLGSLATGCRTAGNGDTPDAPRVVGRWEGVLELEGQPLEGVLQLRDGTEGLEAVFDSGFGLRMEGTGRADAGTVVLDLDYDLECPGRAVLDGRLEEGGRVLVGDVTARDCTGEVDGTFRFERAPATVPGLD